MYNLPREQRSVAAIESDKFAEELLEKAIDKGMLDFDYHWGDDRSTATTVACSDSEDESTDPVRIAAVKVRKRKGHVTPQQLSRNWNIGLEAAKRTCDVTTQMAVRDFTHTTGGRRLKPYATLLGYVRRTCKAYTDTLFGRTPSLRGNQCAQVFATDVHTVAVYPMKKKKDAHEALDKFFKDHGVPQQMVPDNAKDQRRV